jgi:hypothetical protein
MSKVLFVLGPFLTCSGGSTRRATIGATVETLATGSLVVLAGVSLVTASIGELEETDIGNTETASSALINIEILA